MKYDCMSGVANCFHCGASPQEFGQTNSSRIVYKCPDCGRKQFYDGAYVPQDLIVRSVTAPLPKENSK